MEDKEGVEALPNKALAEIALAFECLPELLRFICLRLVPKQIVAALVFLLKVYELALLLIRQRSLCNFLVLIQTEQIGNPAKESFLGLVFLNF